MQIRSGLGIPEPPFVVQMENQCMSRTILADDGYVVYARKSTEGKEKQALSIQSQVDRVRQAFPNLPIAEIITEEKTAFKPYVRVEFEALLQRIEAGEIM